MGVPKTAKSLVRNQLLAAVNKPQGLHTRRTSLHESSRSDHSRRKLLAGAAFRKGALPCQQEFRFRSLFVINGVTDGKGPRRGTSMKLPPHRDKHDDRSAGPDTAGMLTEGARRL